MVAALQADELRLWLEWAGSMFLSMQLRSPLPRGAASSWPEYAQESIEAYGYTGERLRPAIPRGEEIALMDEMMKLPSLINDIHTRRIVNSRMLVRPISQRHLYSWSKLAFMLHTDPRKVVRLHTKGLEEIVTKLPAPQVYTFRRSAASLAIRT